MQCRAARRGLLLTVPWMILVRRVPNTCANQHGDALDHPTSYAGQCTKRGRRCASGPAQRTGPHPSELDQFLFDRIFDGVLSYCSAGQVLRHRIPIPQRNARAHAYARGHGVGRHPAAAAAKAPLQTTSYHARPRTRRAPITVLVSCGMYHGHHRRCYFRAAVPLGRRDGSAHWPAPALCRCEHSARLRTSRCSLTTHSPRSPTSQPFYQGFSHLRCNAPTHSLLPTHHYPPCHCPLHRESAALCTSSTGPLMHTHLPGTAT